MERELVEWLRAALPPHPLLKLGLGDDAAILSQTSGQGIVVTTDSLGDGSHFLLDEVQPRRVGHKCLAVNLSDLAAMAAKPLAAVISLMLPRAHPELFELTKRLYEGMLPLAEAFDVAIAGGDTNVWDGPLTVSVTALGQVTDRGPWRRNSAKPGDAILVSGQLGGSITGRHLDFTPRVREALLLNQRYTLHAGMDITDGLALDLSRLCLASDCGALLRRDAIPISPAAEQLAHAEGSEPLRRALSDGEDFELLLTASQEEAKRMIADAPLACGLNILGEITPQAGLQIQDANGRAAPLEPTGYWHA